MSLKLNSSGGGSVTLQEPTTASNVTLNLPAADGTVVYENASGNVGIGISPKSTLTASTKTFQLPYSLGLTSFTGSLDTYLHSNLYPSSLASGWANNDTGGGNLFRMSGGVFYWYRAASGSADANSSLSESMRIDSSGNLLVGRTNSSVNAAVNGCIIYGSGAADFGQMVFSRGANTVYVSFRNASSGAEVGNIQTNGTNTSYVTSSDYRLKENIQPMQNALTRVASLKPCTYTWKADGSDGEGFIAHELQSVCPEAVSGEKDAVNEDGSIKPQGIDTSFLVATLTAAIQELKAELDITKAKVAALEAQ